MSRRGEFAHEGLDRVMHERARLGILSCMAAAEGDLTFTDLKELCDLTDGNLSRHLSALEEAGIVRIKKRAKGSRPATFVGFTKAGREKFLDYVDLLESIARASADHLRAPGGDDPVPVPEGGA